MRQYWRDFESLEAWPAYSRRGVFEAIYDDLPVPIGMMEFAPVEKARGPMFSARARAGMKGDVNSPVPENDLYGA